MSISFKCPNTSSKEWKALVKHVGSEKKAYRVFTTKGVPIIEKEIDSKYGERVYDIIKVLDRRIKILNNKNKEVPRSTIQLHDKLLTNLIEAQSDASYKASLLHFTETFSSQLTDIDLGIQEIQNMSDDNKSKVGLIRTMRSYILTMMPVLEDIENDLLTSTDEIDKAILEKTVSQITVLKRYSKLIAEQAVPAAAKLFQPFIGARNDPQMLAAINKNLPPDKQVKAINIEDLIMRAEKDIPFLSRWLDSMSDSSDELLKLVNEVVATAKVKARLNGDVTRKRLLELRERLVKSGVHNTDWMYEKDENGLTGNFIEEVERRRFDKDVNDFFTKLNAKYGVKLDKSEIVTDKAKYQAYTREVEAWYDQNTEINPIYKKELQILEESLRSYSKDIREKRIVSYKRNKQELNRGKIGKEFYVPKMSKYGNKVFMSMSETQKEFYNEIIKIKEELDAILPKNLTHGRMVPMVGKDFFERMKTMKNKKDMMEMMSTLFQSKDFDTDLGDVNTEQAQNGKVDEAKYSYVLRDVNKDVGFLPIYFTKKMSNMANLSTDIISSMVVYSNMAYDYAEMNKVIDGLELTRDLVQERKVVKTDYKGRQLRSVSNVRGTVTTEEVYKDNPFSKQRLDDYFSMVIYGRMRAEGIKVSAFGKDIDLEKSLDTLGKYTAISQLAVNLFAGIANVTYGNTMMHVEAMAGKYGNYSEKELLNADKDYYTGLPHLVSEIGKVEKTSKLALYMERFNVMQEFEQESKEVDAIRRTRIAKLFSTSSLFFTNKAGEHFMQGRLSLALANKTRVLVNGVESSLYDAYEVVGNRLVLKKNVTKLDGTEWTMDDEVRFIRKQDFINQRLNGIYNDSDRSAIQKTAIGRLALMFRKFIVPGVHRRFDSLNFNYMDNTWEEGTYRTGYNFFMNMISDLKAGQFSLNKSWNDLTDLQKGNMFRNMADVAALIGTMIVLSFLMGGEDDDKDKWWWNMMSYNAYRMRSDMMFYFNPSETFKILNSPAAATGQLTNLSNFVNLTLATVAPWNWGEWGSEDFTVQSGPYKGWNKWAKSAVQTFPMVRTIQNTINPEERMIYWKRNVIGN